MLGMTHRLQPIAKRMLTPSEASALTLAVQTLEKEHDEMETLILAMLDTRYGSTLQHLINRDNEMGATLAALLERKNRNGTRHDSERDDTIDGYTRVN